MLVTLLIIVLVACIVLWLLQRYVAPLLPPPWGNVMLAIVAVIFIIALLKTAGLLPAGLV